MRKFMPSIWWEDLFRKMDSEHIRTGEVIYSMKLSPGTFFRKRKQFRNGGVLPRKPGNGRKRIYFASQYEVIFKEILTILPPVAGHKRIWMEARKRGVTFSQGTCYKLLKALLLTPCDFIQFLPHLPTIIMKR